MKNMAEETEHQRFVYFLRERMKVILDQQRDAEKEHDSAETSRLQALYDAVIVVYEAATD
jgi:hypothetical protein